MSSAEPLRGADRQEAGQRLAALIQEHRCTILDAGAMLGMRAGVASRIAKQFGIKSDPDALRAKKVAALSVNWNAARAKSKVNSAIALAAHRENLAEQRRARVAEVREMALTMTREAIADATGRSLNAIRKLLKGADLPPRAGRHGARMASRVEVARAERAARADALRAHVETHEVTVSMAGRALGMTVRQAQRLAYEFGIKATRKAIVTRARAVAIKRVVRAKIARIDDGIRAAEARPNPRLSAAQQANVQRGKLTMRAILASKIYHVAPPPNADELIREAIAAGKVTRCPPAFAAPVNNGRGL